MKIEFEYLNSNIECNLNNKEFGKWGCCCKCKFHHEVFKHCCHSPRKDECVCHESLNFYICDHPEIDRINLSGKHGVCELYEERKLSDDEIKKEESINREMLKKRIEQFKNN